LPKWFIARDVTKKRSFDDKEKALEWMFMVQAASDGEVLLEVKNGIWTVYW
jgi:hypothetical protein